MRTSHLRIVPGGDGGPVRGEGVVGQWPFLPGGRGGGPIQGGGWPLTLAGGVVVVLPRVDLWPWPGGGGWPLVLTTSPPQSWSDTHLWKHSLHSLRYVGGKNSKAYAQYNSWNKNAFQ